MGAAVSHVCLGDEAKAGEILRQALAQDKGNEVARENLKWLGAGPAVKGKGEKDGK